MVVPKSVLPQKFGLFLWVNNWAPKIKIDDLKMLIQSNKMDQQTFAIWFAGFYEGEGSVSNDKSNRNRLHICVAQNDRTPLDMACQRWGGTVRKRTRVSPASEKICFGHEWTIRGIQTDRFIEDISPYMIIPYKINQLKQAQEISKQKWITKFKCNFCDKTYTDPSGRRRHEKKEHIDKGTLFQCDICPNTYKSKDSMNRHKKLNH